MKSVSSIIGIGGEKPICAAVHSQKTSWNGGIIRNKWLLSSCCVFVTYSKDAVQSWDLSQLVFLFDVWTINNQIVCSFDHFFPVSPFQRKVRRKILEKPHREILTLRDVSKKSITSSWVGLSIHFLLLPSKAARWSSENIASSYLDNFFKIIFINDLHM